MEKDVNFEELVMSAAEGDDATVASLSSAMEGVEHSKLKEMAANFEFLIESWDESISKSEEKSKLCVRLAEAGALDTPTFRNALNDAVRKLLPPYLSSQGVVKAVGAREQGSQIGDVVARFRKLQKMRTGATVCQTDSNMWGKVSSIDKVTASLGVMSLFGSSMSSLPVAVALANTIFFDSSPEMLSLLRPDRKNVPSASRYRSVFRRQAITEMSDSKMKDVVSRLLVPEAMSPDAFAAWWAVESDSQGAASTGGQRAPWEARSVLELHTLLAPCEEQGGLKLGPDEAAKLSRFFSGLKSVVPKDAGMLGECVSILATLNDGDAFKAVVQPLLGKAPFWPSNPAAAPLKQLEVWGKLSIKHLAGLIKASALLYPPEALAVLGARLPLRCMGPLFETLSPEQVAEAIVAAKPVSSDLIMWMWKGRARLSSRLMELLDIGVTIGALSMEGLPKEWGPAQRELKKTLFDKADYQKFVIENADGDMASIMAALQRARNFQPGEHQSIMVKLSRHSQELKDYIAAGEGKKMMAAGAASSGTPVAAHQAPISSVRSHRQLLKELDDIIKIHIPENVAAITHARGFGDFRENAEYDAAKERRRFLHRRRAELEAQINSVQPTDFKGVKIEGKVVLGSTARLVSDSGRQRDYHIVGAWDGDPDSSCISYKTKLGETLLGVKPGDKVELPDGERCTVKEILPLPDDLRRKLADEK